MEKICFLFGHADTPDDAFATIQDAIITCIRTHGIRSFMVGRYGNFDRLAMRVLRELKPAYCFRILLLCPYALTIKPSDIPIGVDEIVAPPLDGVPKRAHIVAANRYAVDLADRIICYVSRIGNSRELFDYAVTRQIPIINCATQASS